MGYSQDMVYRIAGTKTRDGEVVEYVLVQGTGEKIQCNIPTFFYLLGAKCIQNASGVMYDDGIVARGKGIQIKDLPQVELGSANVRITGTIRKSTQGVSQVNTKEKLDATLRNELECIRKESYERVDICTYDRDPGQGSDYLKLQDERKNEIMLFDILQIRIARNLFKSTRSRINRVAFGRIDHRGIQNIICINTEKQYRLPIARIDLIFQIEGDYIRITYTGPAVDESVKAEFPVPQAVKPSKINKDTVAKMQNYVQSRLQASGV